MGGAADSRADNSRALHARIPERGERRQTSSEQLVAIFLVTFSPRALDFGYVLIFLTGVTTLAHLDVL